MDALPRTTIPPLEKVIHLVFMFHETNAFAAHGSAEKTALLRMEENTLYECHSVSRESVANYAAAYDRDSVLSFFRNNSAYLELEKAFTRAPNEKFNILKGLTSFTSPTRIEAKHVRTIPVAEYPRARAALDLLFREHRHN
jgi:hypothetical protein